MLGSGSAFDRFLQAHDSLLELMKKRPSDRSTGSTGFFGKRFLRRTLRR